MDDRNIKIVETAFRLFAHYGVTKTSMAEIASESGVARQTLYNSFENKEDLIFAALLHYAGQSKANIERDCVGITEIDLRLEILFEHLVNIPFEAMQRLPHLDEILVLGDNLSSERKTQIRDTYMSAIQHVFLPFENQLYEQGIVPLQLYDLLKAVFTQIKRDANNSDHLRKLFEPIRTLLLNSLVNLEQ
ncbi:MAG: TetR/AcrR family transcriptional regulator [Paracoccaceae bacterium]|nr:TetR/AcrR family transcriptional regulator [Paracoccaceae bacterium]MDE2916404.1 TetR/AcrR family transcriptional regulator [Paracoccaceae bacterium]